MQLTRVTGKCLRVDQTAGKTLDQEVPLYDPGYDAKSLVALEIFPRPLEEFNMT